MQHQLYPASASANQSKVISRFTVFAKQATTLILATTALAAQSAQAAKSNQTKAPTKTLVVAAVSNNSTYFVSDGYMHGFGYDLSRAFAGSLGVELEIKQYRSQAAALKAVRKGRADIALTTANQLAIKQIGLTPINLSCGEQDALTKYGLDSQINWSFASDASTLTTQADDFLCSSTQKRITKKLAAFYDQKILQDSYSKKQFNVAMQHRLPAYQDSFQKHANINKLDWQLLVAMGYQESHLKANATSPTGVQGLMMLTNSTAKAMGVSNRVDPSQSIQGGAKYLKLMKSKFGNVPEPDRLWFALASYNMGPGAVQAIQRKLEAQGKDPDSWLNVYHYMSDNAAKNSRYVQCMHYVTRIRTYLETLKKTT